MSNNCIEHYGIKGMEWGKKKTKHKSSVTAKKPAAGKQKLSSLNKNSTNAGFKALERALNRASKTATSKDDDAMTTVGKTMTGISKTATSKQPGAMDRTFNTLGRIGTVASGKKKKK